MKTIRLRYLAEINPPTPESEFVESSSDVLFMPLETVWADDRLDLSRRRPWREVSTGYVRFREGDILCPKVTPTFQAGRSALMTSVPGGVGAATTEVHVVRPRRHLADPRFVRYALMTKRFLEEGVSRFQGVAGLQRVPDSFLRDFEVAELPLDEQRRIANYLDDQTTRIDQAIQLRQQQLAVLRQQLVAVAQAQIAGIDVAGPRTCCDLPWADTLPWDWGTPRICQVARMGTGHTPSRSEPEYWVDCDIPWLTTSDVHRFRRDEIDSLGETAIQISRLGLENSAAVIHPAGTVALSRTASAGFSVVMDTDMATSQDYATWTCGERLLPHYLLWCLRVMRSDLLGRLATGSTHKTIYFPDLMSIRIPLPPIEYQRKAVEEIQRAAQAIRVAVGLLEESIDLMRERRRSLISGVVAGGVG